MEAVVLVTLLAIEAALLAGALAGWFDRRRVGAVVRIGVAVVFVASALAGLVGWGARWYALAVWLVALAAWGVRTLSVEREPARTARLVLTAVAVAAVTVLVTAPAVLFPQYTPLAPTGDHLVRTTSVTVTDPSRTDPFSHDGDPRWIGVQIWYPDVAEASLPLVVFSHGSMGIRTSNESLFEELASHGYVVASVDHPGHALFARDATGRRSWIDSGYLGELRRENAREDPEQSLEHYRRWMELRVEDLDAVVDHLLAEASRPDAPAPFALVDAERIGLVGHSLGGAAVAGLGRLRDDVDAVVVLEAPLMTEIAGVEDGRFTWNPEPYPAPLLNVYSDGAWDHLDEWPQYEMNRRLLHEPPDDGGPFVSVHLAGVGHLHLTDLSLSSPLLTRLLNGHGSSGDARQALRELNVHTLEFFDDHLAGR